ncbi:helix-turn-helix domain-containing protein [Frankia sp. R82]|uniref:PucR family transcriptional regulator n=1 Tax=Frankia sp. R82 TaxID=2950553 RepID=UPI002044CC41|nr:helix-turn-helix domain-containing protein [Frankia sp. R82]MCM3882970.1 helix-turn-helix domain-containing protein [Frankia sp. R82]
MIGSFDVLVATRAGLTAIVGRAAQLAGHPVRLVDPARRRVVRARPDGTLWAASPEPDPSWPSAALGADDAILWLEAARPIGTLQAVVLERAAAAARVVLDRTPTHPRPHDPELLDLVLDAAVAEPDRLACARRLGLPERARAVALHDGTARVLPADHKPSAGTGARELPAGTRAGVGPVATLAELPSSWDAARLALRLTAPGTAADPGPRIVHADTLGSLTLLVRAALADPGPVADVEILTRAAASTPWLLATLDALVTAASLRDAARTLHVHHSTLQDRLVHAESLLGWPLRAPHGRLRLHLALVLRRVLRSAPPDARPAAPHP